MGWPWIPSEAVTIVGETPTFTARQREVAALIAAGCSNEEVAVQLGISARTARAHADVLRQKLGVLRRRHIPMAFQAATGSSLLQFGTAAEGTADEAA